LKNEDLNDLFNDIITFSRKEVKHVLVIEDSEFESSQIAKILHDDHLDVTVAETGQKAIDQIRDFQFDCIILDYMLPDMTGIELLNEISGVRKRITPVIVYSAKDFNKNEFAQLQRVSSKIILKGVNSLEQLLEETILQTHINHNILSADKRRMIENIRSREDILTGKNILVVDDDVRNLFALTTVFERYNINVITAESGREAINILNENPKVDMVLMDIMMPEMDGYETTQKIRREHKNNLLPIIAVTAKAMKGDRQKCIDAGASDYITKPLKIDQLLSLMRVWFYK
jgi:CheY-like chemotaxis protein